MLNRQLSVINRKSSIVNREGGFTLIELAIVLVIIGILIGAIIKGQAILENAKIKRVMADMEGISAAYTTYYDRYNAYPGDDPNATSRWSIVANGNGDGYIGGGGCGSGPSNGQECNEAWQALRSALIITGNPTWTSTQVLPTHPLGGKLYLDYRSFGGTVGTRNYIGVTNLPGSMAEIIDTRFDDGVYNSGTVQASAVYTSATVTLYYAL